MLIFTFFNYSLTWKRMQFLFNHRLAEGQLFFFNCIFSKKRASSLELFLIIHNFIVN